MLAQAISLLVTAAPFTCPLGTVMRELPYLPPPPARAVSTAKIVERFCVKTLPDGQSVLHGPVLLFGEGDSADGQYRDGRRDGTWTYRSQHGVRRTLMVFDEAGQLRQHVSNPDTDHARVEDLVGGWVVKVNGIQMTKEGAEPAEPFDTGGAILRLVKSQHGTEPAPAGTVRPDGSSVTRYLFKVIEPQNPALKTVCATVEMGKNYDVEQVFVGAIRLNARGDSGCGGGIIADGFVDVLAGSDTSVEQARKSLASMRWRARERARLAAIPRLPAEPVKRPQWFGAW